MSFTRIPNNIIDDLKLNPYQFQILSIIIRKTDGWCKVEDGISLSQFEKLVSFKKPKIISTLKELQLMDLIDKRKQIKKDGGNSFNMYKVSNTLVTENDKGSNSGLQGVVTENYTQKKAITKETNTYNNKEWVEEYFYSNTDLNLTATLEWIDYKKNSYKVKSSIKKVCDFLSKYSLEVQSQIVDTSIMNGYQGLFAPKGNNFTNKNEGRKRAIDEAFDMLNQNNEMIDYEC